ncbi:helix-turn-helix domain-containing protein [Amycolatopsis sp. FDAARGOS 1241]|uniref:helix-turn-helix domain-containing protein n=1 Tax=Amycolatopsis sp. FDAARGOS 1241 TaxID=2778070 RepID=UPI0019528861|nr:helix-turn-helix transcriptional regulator [Amycolatopsis sp. FDAARGOS 1241]QRP45129.1 helix-turn-helix domain-containing protein [Amycolatopsis sp. FDAARGOS 1241]
MSEQLREFLRSRRAKITPEEAGLTPHPGPRRVPGLRREEVAQLAGVSVDYYVRLERGRNLNVSESVLDAVARALRLTDLERTHLFTLAKPTRSKPRALPPQRVRPGLQLVLQSLTHVPALVLGRKMDVLGWNHLACVLYTDFAALPARSRNMARLTFLDEGVRSLYVDWEGAARGIVASLHLYAGRYPHDPALAELVGELSVRDQDFRRWWADHDVFERTHGVKHFRHPLAGELVLGYEALTPAGDPDQTLGISTVEPGSPSEERLQLLASWTTQATSDSQGS